jgi:membrane associated rhomboid family serine protease
MSDLVHNPDDYCYRHPDRLSFVLCERCARTICLECQKHVDGHVFCPDDATATITQLSSARSARNARSRRIRTRPSVLDRISPETPIVTYSLIGVIVLLFLVDTFSRYAISPHLSVYSGAAYSAIGVDVLHQPWSLLTSMVLSAGALSLLFNGYAIFAFGRQLEGTFGRQKFLSLYIISGFGASVFAFLLDGSVTSAIGAVFGLVGATVILARKMGGNHLFLYITCAVSVIFAFLFGQWQACVGGLLAGGLTAFTYFFENNGAKEKRTRRLLVGLVALLLVLAIVRAFAFGG